MLAASITTASVGGCEIETVNTASGSPALPSCVETSLTLTVAGSRLVTVMLTVATFESATPSFALKVNESGPR